MKNEPTKYMRNAVDEGFVRSRSTEVSLPDGGLVRLRPQVRYRTLFR